MLSACHVTLLCLCVRVYVCVCVLSTHGGQKRAGDTGGCELFDTGAGIRILGSL